MLFKKLQSLQNSKGRQVILKHVFKGFYTSLFSMGNQKKEPLRIFFTGGTSKCIVLDFEGDAA